MRLRHLLTATLAALLALPVLADVVDGRVEAVDAQGRVVPLAGVAVSNGRQLVYSAGDGSFSLPVQAGDTAFLVKPARYAATSGPDGLPAFWRHHLPEGSPALRYGGIAPSDATATPWLIRLREREAPSSHQVLVFGDPQPRDAVEVGYYAGDIVEPIIGKHPADLGLSLGDIVHDDLSLYPLVNAATARLGIPWLHAAGNHDLDFDAAGDLESLHSFRAAFGPDTFAWEEPRASFVVLDNVIYLPGQRPEYIGGLREDQFAFLAAYLPTVPRERLLVLAAHIPFFDTRSDRETFRRADRERLFAMLEDFPNVLLLTAHGHVQRHHFHGADSGWAGARPLHEYNVGAACGGFWGGVADVDGLPEAGMADGTPNGYALLGLQPDGGYDLRWYVARGDDDLAIALHAPQVLRQGAWPGVGLYANVFMGAEGDRVEFRVGDGEWRPMQRVERADPRVLAENLRDDATEALRGYDRHVEASPSTHLWRAALPTDLAVGEHAVEVRAFDRWRGELRASTRYRLESRERP